MKIAITGGIGSGKSYVCRILEKQGIRVYDCDDEAKRLMRTDARLQAGLKKLVGEQVYSAEGVCRSPCWLSFCWLARLTSRLSTMWFIRLWRAISSRAAMSGWRVPSFR